MNYSFSDKLANLRPSAIREIFKSLTDPSIISFAAGNPSPESFPVEALAALSADIFRTQSTAALQYSITEGYPPLREAIAARLKEKFGIGRDFDSTIVVSGGQQGIELACKAFCNEGDAFWAASEEETVHQAVSELIRMGVLEDETHVLDSHREQVQKAYPAYFDTYDDIGRVIEYLDSFDNLYCVGRNGQHRYNNMDHSMATSFEAVHALEAGIRDRSTIWSVNTEQSYHESRG